MIDCDFKNIYGAGIVAYNAALALHQIDEPASCRFFVSNKMDSNGFGGISANCIDEALFDNGEQILIATPPQYHDEIEEKLIDKGMLKENIVRLDPYMEYSILGEYFKNRYGLKLLSDFSIKESIDRLSNSEKLSVFMAKHVKDRSLKSSYDLPAFVIPVQAGAATSEKKIADTTDDFVGGLSERNGNYSELSVTYWAWKNCQSDYIGICHYRRVYGITNKEMQGIIESGVDLILTLPYMCKESAKEQYFRYVSEEDYEVFIKCLRDSYGSLESWNDIEKALDNQYVYNYNMLIARREIFDEYCRFVFPVLFEMEKYYEGLGIKRNDRYLGYFGEILSSVFFIMNAEKYHTVHVPRIWLA